MTVFLLTGCASGIGLHLANTLANTGNSIIATDVNLEILAQQAQLYGWSTERVLIRQLDVRDPAAWTTIIQEAVERFGLLDVLLNIAGVLVAGHIVDQTSAQVDLQIDVNTKGTIYGTQAAARQMIQQRSGHIINFASLAGLSPVPGIALYSASKFAVRGFSLAADHELRSQGVAVTVICPDAVQTPMLDAQKDQATAALTFSGSKILTVRDIEKVILEVVLLKKPREISLPRSRGWLAKLAGILPNLAAQIAPLMIRRGQTRQAQVRRSSGTKN